MELRPAHRHPCANTSPSTSSKRISVSVSASAISATPFPLMGVRAASSPVVEPRFLVALQTAIHVAADTRRAMAVQQAVQQQGDHRLPLRNRQRRGPYFFPARFLA